MLAAMLTAPLVHISRTNHHPPKKGGLVAECLSLEELPSISHELKSSLKNIYVQVQASY